MHVVDYMMSCDMLGGVELGQLHVPMDHFVKCQPCGTVVLGIDTCDKSMEVICSKFHN